MKNQPQEKKCCEECSQLICRPNNAVECACECHKQGEKFPAEAVNMAFENGKKEGRKELAAELRALLDVPQNEENYD